MNELSEFTQKLSALFIFILIIAGNFLSTLFPCQIQLNLRHSSLMRHIFGLFTMAFLSVVAIQRTSIPLDFKFVTSIVILYSYFLILSKTTTFIWISIFILLGLVYIYQLKKIQMDEDKPKDTSFEEKNEVKKDIIFTITGSIILILTFLGFFSYMGEKKIEHKKRFSYIKFIFGNTTCKGKTTKITFLNSLKHVFD